MNRDETAELLRRRQRLTGHNFDAGVLDTWTDLLRADDTGAAIVAMNRACTKAGQGHVNWGAFRAELNAHLRDRRDRHEEEPLDCALCGGTDWKDAGPDRAGNTSVEPCTTHIRPGRPISAEDGAAFAMVAAETETHLRRERDERLAAEHRAALATGRARPPSPPHIDMSEGAKAMRRLWWQNGHVGHYPTCPCKACHNDGGTR